MKLDDLNKFYREVQTIDIRFEPIEGRTPAMTLEHYDQTTAGYDAEVSELRELALTVILMLKPAQIQFNANRLLLIDERLNRFWKWYGEQMKKLREGEFYLDEFIYYLDSYLFINHSKQHSMGCWVQDAQSFLHDLHDAAMFKQGGVKYLLYEIKILTGIEPQLKTSVEERGKEEERLKNNSQSLLCRLTEKQIADLFEALCIGCYIPSTITLEDFSSALLGTEKLLKPLQWLKGNRDLGYLLTTMFERGMIDNSQWKSIVEKRGLFFNKRGKSLTAQDLAQAVTDYLQKGTPQAASGLESILRQVKP